MTKYDEARRTFLVGAAVGAGAVAGATLVPNSLAQTHEALTTGTAPAPAHSHAAGQGLGAFFNSEDAGTVAAFRRPGRDKQSDRRSIEGSQRYRARMGSYHG